MSEGQREVRTVVISYNPRASHAKDLAYSLDQTIRARGVDCRVSEESDSEAARADIEGADLVFCLGGDGTVLRCARLAIGLPAAILAVNTGRLGFLTEFDGAEVCQRLDDILAGKGRIEERTMLDASVPGKDGTFHALNEVVIGRAKLSRAIQLAVDVDGIRVGDYRCDGVIVATATGSTAYSLSIGGPVLHPESRDLIVLPVAPHLASRHALVLPRTEVVHITLEPGQQAVLSVDGEADLDLEEGDSVLVKPSRYRARFLRLHPPSDFYTRMAAQLGWHRPAGSAQPLPPVPHGEETLG